MKGIKFTCPMCKNIIERPLDMGQDCFTNCGVCKCTIGLNMDEDRFWIATIFNSRGNKKGR